MAEVRKSDLPVPEDQDRFGQFPVIVGVPIALFLTILILGLSQASGFWRALGTGLIVSAAAGLVGAFFGFLFGMPRDLSGRPTLQAPPPSDDEAAEANQEATTTTATDTGRISWANNNLVEVSDWLTKIIVGIGLVEFRQLVPWFAEISNTAGGAAGFADESAQSAFGASVMLASFVYGFLLAYIYARTIIAVIFARAQNEVDTELRRELAKVKIEKAALASEKAILEEREAVGQRRFEAVVKDLPDQVKGPSAVLAALYGAPPEGFTEAIAKARDLLTDPDHNLNPRLHAYLAFGLGQDYRYRHERGASAPVLKALADEAYSALEQALALDAELKPWLRSLWSRDDPAFRPDEDDLVVFWDHPEERARFAKLLT